jgi:hypothetical protein
METAKAQNWAVEAQKKKIMYGEGLKVGKFASTGLYNFISQRLYTS